MASITRASPSGSLELPRRTPFVGRERELLLLAGRLDSAGRGDGGVVLISGEPGIGKTRLLAEFSARAEQDGWLVLSGRSYDTEGMPPYLAFAEAIAQYLRAGADDEAGRRLAEAAREVALLVPELRERLPDADARPSTRPGSRPLPPIRGSLRLLPSPLGHKRSERPSPLPRRPALGRPVDAPALPAPDAQARGRPRPRRRDLPHGRSGPVAAIIRGAGRAGAGAAGTSA